MGGDIESGFMGGNGGGGGGGGAMKAPMPPTPGLLSIMAASVGAGPQVVVCASDSGGCGVEECISDSRMRL